MKTIVSNISRLILLLLTSLTSIALLAQEKSAEINVDINKDSSGGNWYASPWVWVVGAAVFILLLVALLRGSGSRE